MDSYYQQQLSDGQEFQDFVARKLYARGIILINFQSKKEQLAHGENMLGLEIKLDKKFAETDNLWIECAEKTDAAQKDWVASGIDRSDNSWLYGIGNHDEFFVFSKRTLSKHARAPQVRIVENERKTSRGFLISRDIAKMLAERWFVWRDGAKPTPPVVASASKPASPSSRDAVPLLMAEDIESWRTR